MIRLFAGEKFGDGARVNEIEFRVSSGDEIGVAVFLQAADDGGTGEASMAGDVDFFLFSHWGVCKCGDIVRVPRVPNGIPLSKVKIDLP